MLLENIKLALMNFKTNKLRTLLSILGILIGVASVITITSLGASTTENVKNQISNLGLETITIMPGSRSKEVRRIFTEKLAQNIEKNVEGIKTVVPVHQNQFDIQYKKNIISASTLAVTDLYDDIFDIETKEGSFISKDDNNKRRSVVVIGHDIAEELFPTGKVINKYVRLFRGQAKNFKVIGVLKERSQSIGVSFNSSVYIPYDTYSHRIEKIQYVRSFAVGTTKGSDVLKVSENIENYLLAVSGDEDNYRVISPTSIAETFTQVTGTLNIFLAGIAAISLLVGGIGIMNIMLVSVTERTREIGIRKALGAPPSIIMGQFLTEAVTLTLLGGIIGLFTGTAISYIIVQVFQWAFAPQLESYIIAFIFSSSIGIFFGFYPAVRASRLDPITALSYE